MPDAKRNSSRLPTFPASTSFKLRDERQRQTALFFFKYEQEGLHNKMITDDASSFFNDLPNHQILVKAEVGIYMLRLTND